jgi:hypothetical protein
VVICQLFLIILRIFTSFYLEGKDKLEKFDISAMENFASKALLLIEEEKRTSNAKHDLEILEYNMNLLKMYATKIQGYEPDTDEYDFALNDCKNLIKSTKKWLELEKLI